MLQPHTKHSKRQQSQLKISLLQPAAAGTVRNYWAAATSESDNAVDLCQMARPCTITTPFTTPSHDEANMDSSEITVQEAMQAPTLAMDSEVHSTDVAMVYSS